MSKTVDLTKLSTEELFGVFVDSHVWGTPGEVAAQLKERLQGVGAGRFVGVFQFGSMPLADAQRSLRLFAQTVLPELHAMALPEPVLPQTAEVTS
jgi:hypothetical protein